MKKLELDEGDLYISEQVMGDGAISESEDYPGMLENSYLDSHLGTFFEHRPSFKEYIDLYGQLNNLPRIAMLKAHGGTKGNLYTKSEDWVFRHGPRGEYKRPVQDWIDENDGKYSALLLAVCNMGSHTPKSKKSILMIPDKEISFSGDISRVDREAVFDLIFPGIGEIDSYTIDYELERLKEQMASR
jgi:hypothetical protein